MPPMRRLNLLVQDEQFFEKNTFDEDELRSLFMDILLENDLTDAHLSAIVALSRALRGTHPQMALKVKILPAGVTPRPLRDIERNALVMQVADHIDMQVAHQVKQDAAVQEAMDKFNLSRREVFRMLKRARQRRIRMLEQAEEFADWDYWYEDYEIDVNGRLVPAERNS